MSIDLDDVPAASVIRLVEFVVGEADREGSALLAPLVQAQLSQALVYSLLSGFRHNHARFLENPSSDVDPVHLRRAEEYIAANVREPVTISDMAAAAGVSAGTLFAAFRARRGCSPIAFLRTCRFHLAGERLLAGSATSVAGAAHACGFEHLGRFSVGYRKLFGESPRQTLARSRTT